MTEASSHTPPLGDPGFLHGLRLPLRGLVLVVRTPGLRGPAVVPVLLATVLLGVSAWLAVRWGADLGARLLPAADGGFVGSVRAFATALMSLAIFAGLAIVSWTATKILAGPWHDRIAARVEAMEGLRDDAPTTVGAVVRDTAVGALHSLQSLLLYAALACPLQLLLLVPVAGEVVVPAASALLSSFFLAREVLDFPTSRRRWSFRDKLRLVARAPRSTLGLGVACLALLWVPVLSLVLLPGAVAGGALLFAELHRRGLTART